MQFASRMNRIETSASAMMSQKAREMKLEGRDVIALSSGQPDFPTPSHIIEAAMQAANRGETKYTTISGSNDHHLRKVYPCNGHRSEGVLTEHRTASRLVQFHKNLE